MAIFGRLLKAATGVAAGRGERAPRGTQLADAVVAEVRRPDVARGVDGDPNRHRKTAAGIAAGRGDRASQGAELADAVTPGVRGPGVTRRIDGDPKRLRKAAAGVIERQRPGVWRGTFLGRKGRGWRQSLYSEKVAYIDGRISRHRMHRLKRGPSGGRAGAGEQDVACRRGSSAGWERPARTRAVDARSDNIGDRVHLLQAIAVD